MNKIFCLGLCTLLKVFYIQVQESFNIVGLSKPVYKGQNTLTGDFVAIKAIGNNLPSIKIWENFDHPNIIKFIDYIEQDFYVMELAENGDLFSKVLKETRLQEEEAKYYFLQLLDAVEYVHSKGYTHNDIKLENILLKNNNQLKLADFEFVGQSSCGSVPYAAPEILLGKPLVMFQSDAWSLGVCLYSMVAGFLPFDAKSEEDIIKHILENDLVIPLFFSAELSDLVKSLLVFDPVYRNREIRKHLWLS